MGLKLDISLLLFISLINDSKDKEDQEEDEDEEDKEEELVLTSYMCDTLFCSGEEGRPSRGGNITQEER